MPRGPPKTKTTPDAQTTVIDAAPWKRSQDSCPILPPTKPGVAGCLEMISLDPTQAFRIVVPPETFVKNFHELKFGNVNAKNVNTSDFEAQFRYMADHPPDYGLVTNFPRDSWDSTCFLWPGVRESLLGLGQEDLGDYKKERNYRVEEVGSEGKGVVAARDFQVGDLIIIERPAILQPMFMQGFGEEEIEGLLHKMVARLPDDVMCGYLTLANCHPEGGPLTGILRTNSIRVSFPGNVMGYRAVAVDISRCSHSCAPNATRIFNPAKFALELRAVCPINAGEQVTISYTDMLQSAATRSKELRQLWLFNCRCSFCTLPPSERRQSDQRRANVGAFRVPFEGPLSGYHEIEMHATIKAMVACTKEQVWRAQHPMLAFLAFRSLALGDASGWKKWAPKAAAMTLACFGKTPHYYFYSATEPRLLLPFWNSKSLVGMLDVDAFMKKVNVECMVIILTAKLRELSS